LKGNEDRDKSGNRHDHRSISVVYWGIHRSTHDEVSIKAIWKQTTDEKLIHQIKQEFDIFLKEGIKDDVFIRLLDIMECGPYCYFVYEW
jgi:hypothetical protein